MIGPLTYLDLGVIAIAFISGLLALYRGLTRELLAILSWIIAALAVLYFILNHRAFAEEVAQQMGAQVLIAQGVIGILIFLIVLIVVHLVTARISDTILDSQIGMIDRILGFGFGVVRGFVLIVIPFMLALQFWPDPQTHPDWVRNAKTRPLIEQTGDVLRGMLIAYVVPLMDRATEKQQAQEGASLFPDVRHCSLAQRGTFHISVTCVGARPPAA